MRIGNIKDDKMREEAEETRAAATGSDGKLLAPKAAANLSRVNEIVDLWVDVHHGRGRPPVTVARAWITSLKAKGDPRPGTVQARLAAAAAKAARAAGHP